MFRAITQNFYHALVNNQEFKNFYKEMKTTNEWNTSLLKFADNIVMGTVKKNLGKEPTLLTVIPSDSSLENTPSSSR